MIFHSAFLGAEEKISFKTETLRFFLHFIYWLETISIILVDMFKRFLKWNHNKKFDLYGTLTINS